MTTSFPGVLPTQKCRNFLVLAPLTLFLILTMTSRANAAPKIVTFDGQTRGQALSRA